MDRGAFGSRAFLVALQKAWSEGRISEEFHDIADAAGRQYRMALDELVRASGRLGTAGGAHAAVTVHPGHVPVTGADAAYAGSGTLDRVIYVPASGDRPAGVIVIEEKGGGADLETAVVAHPSRPGETVKVRQTSPAYVRDRLQTDRYLAWALGIAPPLPDGTSLRAALQEAVRAGRVRSVLVHTTESGTVTWSEHALPGPAERAFWDIELATTPDFGTVAFDPARLPLLPWEEAVATVVRNARVTRSGIDLSGTRDATGRYLADRLRTEPGIVKIAYQALLPDTVADGGWIVVGGYRINAAALADGLAILQREGRLPDDKALWLVAGYSAVPRGEAPSVVETIAQLLKQVVTGATDQVFTYPDGHTVVAVPNSDAPERPGHPTGAWMTVAPYGGRVTTLYRDEGRS